MSAGGVEIEVGGGRPAGRRLLAYRWLLLVGLLVAALDQLTKAWIMRRLPFDTYGEGFGAITVIRGVLYLVHRGNTGAAWSLYLGRSVPLAIFATVTLAAIAVWRHTLGLKAVSNQVCFGLLCGGIVGNLTDRLRHGYVTDFIDVHIGRYVYPTFNVADCGICVGIGLYLVLSLGKTPAESRN